MELTMIARQPTGAVAYVRKSVAGRSEADRSMDNQLAAIRALATRDGVALARVYDADWGISAGREKRASRRALTELIDDVKAGTVTALYAYALDRLARDTENGLTLWHACAAAGVPIVTDSGRYDTSDSTDRLRFVLTTEMAAGQLDSITKTNRRVKARAKLNGTALGGRPVYGSDPKHPEELVSTIVAAVEEAGSFRGAARILDEAGVHPRFGGAWEQESVALIYRRACPDAPAAEKRGQVSQARTSALSGLLRCACGSTLSHHPRVGRVRADGTVTEADGSSWYCRTAGVTRGHARPFMIADRVVRRWAINASAPAHEAAYLQPDLDGIVVKGVAEKRERIAQGVIDGTLSRDRALKALADLDALVKANDNRERAKLVIVRSVDWSGSEASINSELRAIWSRIELDGAMLPVRGKAIYGPDTDATALDWARFEDSQTGADAAANAAFRAGQSAVEATDDD
jgi:DNA invertase Pin-like site-specific DNA recombinase